MDPLTAIGLAGNIIAFIDFAAKLLDKTKEIHSSATGSTEADRTLRQVTRDLQRLSLGLKNSQSLSGAQAPEAEALVDLCSDCEDLAEELLGVLNDVQTKDPSSKRQSIKAAIKRLWKAKDIEELQCRLELVSRALDRRTQLVFRTEIRDRLSEIVESGKSMRLDIAELQARVEAIRGGVTTASFGSEALKQLKDLIRLSDAAVLRTRQRAVLDALWFHEMNDRVQEVNEAHEETFEWILRARELAGDPGFDSARKELATTTLRQWLSEDRGILHVLGKPGSGKSTLMKFLFQHPRVRHLLETWAGNKPLVAACFFFWRSGSRLQRTTEGLTRSLLYSVLEQVPSLIPTTFPTEWARTDPAELGKPALALERAKIFEAFERFIDGPEVLASHRFVFFVDGLDEFEPDGHRATHLDFVQSLKKWCLKQPGSIKMCVSSREYPVFETEFAQFSRLRLQDLTLDDMHIVARDFLQGKLISQLGLGGKEIKHLEEQIVSKSDGVFLWLTLVIRNLEIGLINGDSFTDLSSRVLSLPTELSDLFSSLLGAISPHDQSYCLPLLRVLYEVDGVYPISLLMFWCMDIAFRSEDVADVVKTIDQMGNNLLTAEERLIQHIERLCRRIQGRFCGLLRSPLPGLNALRQGVGFNHLSIQEFLASDKATRYLGPEFSECDWYSTLCAAFELQFKLVTHPNLAFLCDPRTRSTLFRYAETHISELWSNLITPLAAFTRFRFTFIPRNFLDTIDRCDRLLSKDPASSTRWDSAACPDAAYRLSLYGLQTDEVTLRCRCKNKLHFSMELCMAKASVHEYFQRALQAGRLAQQTAPPELLLAALIESRRGDFEELSDCVAMFRTFLEAGVSPHSPIQLRICDRREKTALRPLFCLVLKVSCLTYYVLNHGRLLEIIYCFVKAGVDTRLWFLKPDWYSRSPTQSAGLQSLVGPHRDTMSDSDHSEYEKEEMHVTIGDLEGPDEEDRQPMLWACQLIMYPPVQWAHFSGPRQATPYTLLDMMEEKNVSLPPDVYDLLLSAKDDILRQIARYGLPQQDALQRWGNRDFYMFYPQAPRQGWRR